LAAWRRMSRSVASSVCSTMSSAFSVSNAATRARRAPSSASGVPARAAVVLAFGPTETRGPSGPARAPTPAACAVRYPGPRRSLVVWCPGSTGTGRQPGAGTPACSLAGHDRGSSRFPGRGRIQRV
jgi:hypothetical protein